MMTTKGVIQMKKANNKSNNQADKKRLIRNIVMILAAAALCTAMVFTYKAQIPDNTVAPNQNMGQSAQAPSGQNPPSDNGTNQSAPPSKPDENGENKSGTSDNSNNNNSTDNSKSDSQSSSPKQGGDSSQQPPSLPTNNKTDSCGVMIYQSMSGDAGTGEGTFTSKNSTLTISSDSDYYKSAPMFFVTNTDASINLTNTKLSYGSDILLSAKGTSEWGNSGSNGGNVTLTAKNQTLKGNITADKISTVTIKMTSSDYTGTINGDNSAEKISLTLDSNSKIKLTGDSYVTSLSDSDGSYSNIDLNGYTLYVNGKALTK